MTISTPTQNFVKGLMEKGRWPAMPGEILDPSSLTDNQKLMIQWYMMEEALVQQGKTNQLLLQILDAVTPKKPAKK